MVDLAVLINLRFSCMLYSVLEIFFGFGSIQFNVSVYS